MCTFCRMITTRIIYLLENVKILRVFDFSIVAAAVTNKFRKAPVQYIKSY